MKRDEPLIPRGGPTRGALVLIILLAAGVIIAIGLQQRAFQQQQTRETQEASDRAAAARRQAVCVERWGKEVIDTITARTAATGTVDEADKRVAAAATRRDAAIDAVLDAVIGLRSIPPEATTADLDAALRRFSTAKAALNAARETVKDAEGSAEQTRQQNPYPLLDCN